MKVEVRLFAGFRTGRFGKRTMELPEGTSLRDLVRQLEIPEEEVALPLINGRYGDLDRRLADSDVAALFPAVAGG